MRAQRIYEVKDMAKKQKTDAYTKLKHMLVVALALTVLLAVGFVLTRNYVDQRLVARQAEIDRQNEELMEQYQQRLAEHQQKQETGENIAWPAAAQTGWDILDVSNFALTGTTRHTVSRNDLYSGGLLLVNRWHELPADFSAEDMTSVGRTYRDIQVTDFYVVLRPNVIEALKVMLDAAKAEGVDKFLIEEGYRTNERQSEYFLEEQNKWTNKYVGQALIEKARDSVNVPGTSEYQTGLSFRVRRYDRDSAEFNSVRFEGSEHMTWLLERGWEYGFVFRFPVEGYPNDTVTDKAWKTGESKKLRIMRYVGQAPAAVMQQMDLCLEEFIEYMIAHPHIAVYQDGTLKYELVRVADTGEASVTVDVTASAKSVQTSSDNMGGIIIAMSY